MSTRAQITVEGQEIKFYKHSDGYPSGVLPTLLPFVTLFMSLRGFDIEYMLTRMVIAFGKQEEKERQALLEDPTYAAAAWLQKPEVLGLGLDTAWHEDIEYAYVIRSTGAVEVYKTSDHYADWLSGAGYFITRGKRRADPDTTGARLIAVLPLGTTLEEAREILGMEN